MPITYSPLDYVDLLPIEIWREAFMRLKLRDQRMVTFTCRLFRDICLPFTLKSVSFALQLEVLKDSNREVIARDYRRSDRDVQLLRKIAGDPWHATLVRQMKLKSTFGLTRSKHIDKSISSAAKDVYKSFHSAVLTSLTSFVNLEELYIQTKETMKQKTFSMISSLPRLRKLYLSSVQFGVRKLKHPIGVPNLTIIHDEDESWFRSHSREAIPAVELFSGDALEELTLLSRVHATGILLGLMSQGFLLRLTDLTVMVNPEDMPVLYQFLEQCPTLAAIDVDILSTWDSVTAFPGTLTAKALPHLRSCRTQDCAVPSFISQRPVEKIGIRFYKYDTPYRTYDYFEEIIPTLLLTTGTIKDLDVGFIDLNPMIFSLITAQFPALRRLALAVWRSQLRQFDIDMEETFVSLSLATTTESRIPRVSHSGTDMLPSDVNVAYLEFLLWMALQNVELPPSIEEIYFNLYIFVDEYHFRTTFKPDGHDENWGGVSSVVLLKRTYTFSKVHAIFEDLSIRHPTLQRVVVGKASVWELTWSRGLDNRWTWAGWKC